MHLRTLACLLSVCAVLPVAGQAQETVPIQGAGSVVRYDADFFKTFQVNSAYDMVQRVPGFVFDAGESARGFAGTAGNVVIDGQRPASKADLGNTLSNINAAQVDHVELITGGAPGIDMHGQRQIVNVVRKADARPSLSLQGTWRNMDGRSDRGVLWFSFNDNRNGRSTDVTADVYSFFDNEANHARREVRYADGRIERLEIPQHAGGGGVDSQASHSRPLWGGKLSLNGSYNPWVYRYHASFIGAGTANETYIENEIPSEFGSQYERKFGHGLGLDFNLLRRHTRNQVRDGYADQAGASSFQALSLSDEHVAGGRVSWERDAGLTLSAGTEQAFNSLDKASSYASAAASPSVSQVRVQEDRTESFVAGNWQASPKLGLEAEVKVETSTISVPQSHRADSFVYYKPRLQAVYALSPDTKLSWKAARQVDQLSFSSFASSVDLQASKVTLGNTALVPQKMWLNTLILEQSFWTKGAFSVAYEHYDVEDTSDFIAVFDGSKVYTASGNIGRSKFDYLKLKLDLPLDPLHVRGGTLSVDWTNRQTAVTDPVTGDQRRLSGAEPNRYEVNFIQDFPDLSASWGVNVESRNSDRNYQANELNNSRYDPWSEVWLQYQTPQKLQLRMTLKNPLGLRYTRDRVVYQGLRDLTPVSYVQHQTARIPPILEVKLKKDL